MFANWLIPLIVAVTSDPACAAPACTCAPPRGTALDAAAEARAVFLGTPVGVRSARVRFGSERRPARVYTFRVQSSWKGVEGETIQIITGLGDGDCGIRFRLHSQYLVYADDSDGGGPGVLAAGLCSRTRARDDAEADVSALGTPERSWR